MPCNSWHARRLGVLRFARRPPVPFFCQCATLCVVRNVNSRDFLSAVEIRLLRDDATVCVCLTVNSTTLKYEQTARAKSVGSSVRSGVRAH